MIPVDEIFQYLPELSTLSKMLLYFIGSAVLAFIIAPFIINFLYKHNIRRVAKGDIVSKIDIEKGKIGTPIMGGLIVVIPVLIITLILNWEQTQTYLPIGCLVLSCCVGGIDDLLNIFGKDRKQPLPLKLHLKLATVHKSFWRRLYYFITIPWAAFKRAFLLIGSKPKSGLLVHERILLQAFIGLTVGIWVYKKLGWSDVWIPFLSRSDLMIELINSLPYFSVNVGRSSIEIGWLMVPFITLTIMTVTNAVNISDGMDGLVGGVMLIAFIGYSIVAFNLVLTAIDPETAINDSYRHLGYLTATTAGGLLAYLYFNVKPARVQIGDFGALGLGTLLAVVAVAMHREFTLLFMAGVFLFDGVFSRILQWFWKKLKGRKLFKIIPLHYHFEMLGWPEEKVVVRFWLVGIFLIAVGIWLAGV